MATRLRLDHDLDPNQHRILGCRGADAVIGSGGDLTLGQGNGFEVTGSATLRRISTANWLQDSSIDLRFPSGVTIANGEASSGGFAGITTTTGEAMSVAPGLIVRLVLFGDSWVVHIAGTFDDHKVIAVGGDTPDVLYQKVQVRYPLVESVGGTAPNQHVLIGIELPSGPDPTPAGVSTKLYPAKIADPFLRDPVRALSALGAGYGLNLTDDWHPAFAVYTWQRNSTNPILAYVDGGSGNFPMVRGDRFYVANPSGDPVASVYTGIYQVLTQGDGVSVHALIQRVPDANTPETLCTGMVTQIGPGVGGAGQWITLTTGATVVDTTALAYAIGSYSTTEAWRLLTGPQLTSEGASADVEEFAWTMVSGHASAPHDFGTLAGTPGVDAMAAGLWQTNIEAVWIDPATPPSAGSTTTFRWRRILDHGGTSTELSPMESPPLTNTAPLVLSFAYSDPGHSPSPTDRLVFLADLNTTSTTPVTLHVRYNSAARGTWVQLPFAMAVGGASDGVHGHLSGGSDPGQHPRFAITDAIGAATVTGDGASTRLALAAPYRSGEMSLSDILVLYGVDPTGWSDGQVLELFVDGLHPGTPSSNLTLVHLPGNSDGSDVYVGVNLATGAGQNATYTRPVALKLKRRARLNRWQLMEARM